MTETSPYPQAQPPPPAQRTGWSRSDVVIGGSLVGLLIALFLATTFWVYGLIRKQVAAEAQTGLFVECLVLSPLALGYIVWLGVSGAGSDDGGDRADEQPRKNKRTSRHALSYHGRFTAEAPAGRSSSCFR